MREEGEILDVHEPTLFSSRHVYSSCNDEREEGEILQDNRDPGEKWRTSLPHERARKRPAKWHADRARSSVKKTATGDRADAATTRHPQPVSPGGIDASSIRRPPAGRATLVCRVCQCSLGEHRWPPPDLAHNVRKHRHGKRHNKGKSAPQGDDIVWMLSTGETVPFGSSPATQARKVKPAFPERRGMELEENGRSAAAAAEASCGLGAGERSCAGRVDYPEVIVIPSSDDESVEVVEIMDDEKPCKQRHSWRREADHQESGPCAGQSRLLPSFCSTGGTQECPLRGAEEISHGGGEPEGRLAADFGPPGVDSGGQGGDPPRSHQLRDPRNDPGRSQQPVDPRLRGRFGGAATGEGATGLPLSTRRRRQPRAAEPSPGGHLVPNARSCGRSADVPAFLEGAMTPQGKGPAPTAAGRPAPENSGDRRASEPPAPTQRVLELLRRRRLPLVLDLDHTLVNSVRWDEVDEQTASALKKQAASRNHHELHFLPSLGMWTKLRPGARRFLATASRHFELWIHTNGNKPYAAAIAQLLDPDGVWFRGRIIAQGLESNEGTAFQVKSFAYGLDGLEALSIIVDDSHSVWPDHSENLLPVERYVYFSASRQRLGLPGPSLMELSRDECSDRGMLSVVQRVLLAVHQKMFEQLGDELNSYDALVPKYGGKTCDIRAILSTERRKVLQGCCIVFSHAIPLGQDPCSHRLWQLAEKFGAMCVKGVDNSVTHVVAGASGTEKVLWGRNKGKFIVTPSWLEASCILWQRAHEDEYPLPNN